MERSGLLFVMSGPSGAGKTTLCNEVVAIVPGLQQSISYTTRTPRPGEVNGRDYVFIQEAAFHEKVRRNEFAEWAHVHGHFYGTLRSTLTEMLEKGLDVLLEIDTQGAKQIKKIFTDAVFIYIMPPSIESIRTRLEQRGGDSPGEIQRRLQKAREEVWSYRDYFYIIRNDAQKEALKGLEAIILAERIKTKRLDIGWLEEKFIREMEDKVGDRLGSKINQGEGYD